GTETRGSLEETLSALGAELLVACVASVARGDAVFTPQDEAKATHVGKIEVEDAKLDLARPAAELERLVRAVAPEPTAWLDLPSGRLQVLKASLGGEATQAPGLVERVTKDALIVATSAGALALLSVKPRRGPKPQRAPVRALAARIVREVADGAAARTKLDRAPGLEPRERALLT